MRTPVKSTWVLGHHLRGKPGGTGENIGTTDAKLRIRAGGDTVVHDCTWIINHAETGVVSLAAETHRHGERLGEYRRDVNDFIELCRRCHRTYDGGGNCLT